MSFPSGAKITPERMALLLPSFVRKTTSETVTSSTTLQNDDTLVLAMAATGVYEVAINVRYDGATGGDLKIGFSAPAAASFNFNAVAMSTTAALYTDDQTFIGELTSTPTFGCLGVGTVAGCLIQGLLVGGGTAGNFQFQWAQGTSSATSTRVFGGSYMTLRRFA